MVFDSHYRFLLCIHLFFSAASIRVTLTASRQADLNLPSESTCIDFPTYVFFFFILRSFHDAFHCPLDITIYEKQFFLLKFCNDLLQHFFYLSPFFILERHYDNHNEHKTTI